MKRPLWCIVTATHCDTGEKYMADPWKRPSSETNIPAEGIVAVSASDTVDLPDGLCRALLVGTAGAATVIDAKGQTATLIPLQAGYNPIRVSRVKSTGLTAANIWALY